MTALKLFTKLINSILVIALDSTDKDSNGIFHGKYKYGFTSCLILKNLLCMVFKCPALHTVEKRNICKSLKC